MAHRSEFYVYKRKKKRGSYWYVCYVDSETGKQGTAKSIDVLKERLGLGDNRATKRRDEAVIIAKKALDECIIYSKPSNIPFFAYCEEFWDFDRSQYIRLRNNLKPGSIGKEYAQNMLFFFRKHVEPFLPPSIKLSSVTTSHLDSVIRSLYECRSLSSGTIQLISISFRQPLKEAERVGLISSDPSRRMMRIERTERPRGCLTEDECRRLCALMENRKESIFPSYYLAIKLGLCTGMRSGEIRALNVSDIMDSAIPGYHLIRIRNSIAPYSGLKCTKGKYERAVLVPSDLAYELIANADEKGRVIKSKHGRGYVSSPTIRNFLYSLLDDIGMDEGERERRNITFHSLRHTFSTLGRDNSIAQEDRMLVLGHKSTDVNDRYTHETEEALLRVSRLTSTISGFFSSGGRRG